MEIAVLGLGRFGSQIVRELGQLGHEVLAVDLNEASVERAAPHSAKAAVADITNELALRDLGVGNVDAVVVGTGVIEASVLAAMNAQALGVTAVYAKASNELHASILERIGITRVVQPERDGGERFAHLLRVQGARDYLSISHDYGIAIQDVPEHLHGRTLGEVDSHDGTRRLLIAVRSGEVELNPVRDRTIGPGDMLVFAGRDEDLAREL